MPSPARVSDPERSAAPAPSYVLPLKWSDVSQLVGLVGYLEELRHHVQEIIVIDGSTPAVYETIEQELPPPCSPRAAGPRTPGRERQGVGRSDRPGSGLKRFRRDRGRRRAVARKRTRTRVRAAGSRRGGASSKLLLAPCLAHTLGHGPQPHKSGMERRIRSRPRRLPGHPCRSCRSSPLRGL